VVISIRYEATAGNSFGGAAPRRHRRREHRYDLPDGLYLGLQYGSEQNQDRSVDAWSLTPTRRTISAVPEWAATTAAVRELSTELSAPLDTIAHELAEALQHRSFRDRIAGYLDGRDRG